MNSLYGQEATIIADFESGSCANAGLEQLKATLRKGQINFREGVVEDDVETPLLIIASTNPKFINESAEGKQSVATLPGSFSIFKSSIHNKEIVVVHGYDPEGLMYGLYDIAEKISWSKGNDVFSAIQNSSEKPYIAERAVSTYTMNRRYWEDRMFDENYWKSYFDLLSKSRFNMFTIIFGYENGGFLAPCYPYFFDVENYPEVKLEGLSREQQQKNLDAMNRIIQLAHQRGIKITLGIWDHIFRGGIQSGDMGDGANIDPATNVIVTGLNSDNLIPYTAAALNKLIEKLPGLDAIQFRMHGESGLKHSEQRPFWSDLFQSIKKNHPQMRLVLRAKDLPDEIIDDAIASGVNFSIGTKFWMEQTGLPFSPTKVYKQDQKNRRHGYADMLRYPQQYKMYWRLWTGGTNRILTWGDPDYVSRFVKSLAIYENGSFGFEINEMLATKMEAQAHNEVPFELLTKANQYYRYEFERYWDFYNSYGRMGYNPDAVHTFRSYAYRQHYGEQAGKIMEDAVQEASKILPRIVASAYNYSFFPTTRGWAEKQRIGDLHEYAKSQGSDVQQFANFEEEAALLLNEGETAKILPSNNSVWFKNLSDKLNTQISEVEKMAGSSANKELKATITDLKILSNLARYHSRRIPAAVYFSMYKKTNNAAALDSAIGYERKAIAAWENMIAAAGDMYAPNLKFGPAHTGFEGIAFEQSGHWRDELALLQKDLEKLETELKNVKPAASSEKMPLFPTPKEPTNAGFFTLNHQPILEAEKGNPVTINVHIKARAGIKWVRLQYRAVNQYLDFEMLPMQPTNEKDTYEVTIPADKVDQAYNLMYLIEVMDNNGKGFIYPDLNRETPYVVVKLKR